MPYPKIPLETRFWMKVDKRGENDCWLWTGAADWDGYGVIINNGKNIRASRLSLELAGRPLKPENFACHNCPNGDNPRCVNPNHLFEGTHRENTDDMIKKGRSLTGEKSPHCKYPDVIVKEMVDLFKQGGISKAEIARQYGCTDVYVSYLINGKARSTATGMEKAHVGQRRNRAA